MTGLIVITGLTVILAFIALVLWLIHPALLLIAAALVITALVVKALSRRPERDLRKTKTVMPSSSSSTISPPSLVTLLRTAEAERLIGEKPSLWPSISQRNAA
jgi:protein-S-isoprenylcysteine O-methyltransferase Ste14